MEPEFRDYFCSCCGSLLCLSTSKIFNNQIFSSSNVQLICIRCGTQTKDISSHSYVPLRQKLKAEIIKDSDMWANASVTEERCPQCMHTRAYFHQVQTRSADEPMTTYYRCEKCAHNWKD